MVCYVFDRLFLLFDLFGYILSTLFLFVVFFLLPSSKQRATKSSCLIPRFQTPFFSSFTFVSLISPLCLSRDETRDPSQGETRESKRGTRDDHAIYIRVSKTERGRQQTERQPKRSQRETIPNKQQTTTTTTQTTTNRHREQKHTTQQPTLYYYHFLTH